MPVIMIITNKEGEFAKQYLRYGLQAAMNLSALETVLPFILLSHIISLIKPIASVVLASSKKTTVSKPYVWFVSAIFSASSIQSIISF